MNMVAAHSVDRFVSWFQGVDRASFQNEDDVETKLVLPLFLHLGYPEPCRRGKYPIASYNPGKAGRKPEADQVYFSTEKAQEQNRDTCLLVVEAKEPKETDLRMHLDQAQFYGYHLVPSFLALTNGSRLMVLKRRGFESEEVVCDDEIERLQEPKRAEELFQILNYEVVKTVKRDSLDQLSHTRYVQLDESLRRYPNLREILDQGDFRPYKSLLGDQAICVEPKVAVTARLPVALKWGAVAVEFSNITRRGLHIQLDHTDVLRDLILGLRTPPEWGMRPFIRSVGNEVFEVRLGDVTTAVEAEEARQLCACVDYTCSEYRRIIDETDAALESRPYHPVLTGDAFEKGWRYLFLTIEKELWKSIKAFVEEFDYAQGDSEWHIFNAHHSSDVRVQKDIEVEHTHISPRPVINDGSRLPEDYVDLLYTVETYASAEIERVTGLDWIKSVGPAGLWSVASTQRWMIEQLIPAVRRRFSPGEEQRSSNPYRDQGIMLHDVIDLSTAQIESAASFVPYLEYIQEWLCSSGRRVPARLLCPYYRAFSALAKRLRRPPVDLAMLGYIVSKLEFAETDPEDRRAATSHSRDDLYTTDRVFASLDRHVTRISHVRYEDSHRADLITRGLMSLLRDSTIDCSQAHLTVAKDSLLPVWVECRFEQRYIFGQAYFIGGAL
jgi:hypothetical protein